MSGRRRIQAPGGDSTLRIGGEMPMEVAPTNVSSNRFANNNMQNSGNYMTDRSTVQVQQAPGGHSSLCLGSDTSDPFEYAEKRLGRGRRPAPDPASNYPSDPYGRPGTSQSGQSRGGSNQFDGVHPKQGAVGVHQAPGGTSTLSLGCDTSFDPYAGTHERRGGRGRAPPSEADSVFSGVSAGAGGKTRQHWEERAARPEVNPNLVSNWSLGQDTESPFEARRRQEARNRGQLPQPPEGLQARHSLLSSRQQPPGGSASICLGGDGSRSGPERGRRPEQGFGGAEQGMDQSQDFVQGFNRNRQGFAGQGCERDMRDPGFVQAQPNQGQGQPSRDPNPRQGYDPGFRQPGEARRGIDLGQDPRYAGDQGFERTQRPFRSPGPEEEQGGGCAAYGQGFDQTQHPGYDGRSGFDPQQNPRQDPNQDPHQGYGYGRGGEQGSEDPRDDPRGDPRGYDPQGDPRGYDPRDDPRGDPRGYDPRDDPRGDSRGYDPRGYDDPRGDPRGDPRAAYGQEQSYPSSGGKGHHDAEFHQGRGQGGYPQGGPSMGGRQQYQDDGRGGYDQCSSGYEQASDAGGYGGGRSEMSYDDNGRGRQQNYGGYYGPPATQDPYPGRQEDEQPNFGFGRRNAPWPSHMRQTAPTEYADRLMQGGKKRMAPPGGGSSISLGWG